MDQSKQALELIKETLAIGGDVGAGRFAHKAQFANEMSQAKLDGDRGFFHIRPIRRKAIMPQHRLALARQKVFQNLAGARGREVKHGKGRYGKNPCPQQVTLVFVAGFVDVELFLLGQGFDQRLIDGLERLADFVDELGQHPGRKAHAQALVEERL